MTHTANRELEGQYIGDVVIRNTRQSILKINNLLEHKTDWVGWYRSQNGKDQIAAFSYSPGLSSLVSLHVPKKGGRA